MRALFVGAHADDEVLAAGGCLLKHWAAGDEISWVLVATPEGGLWTEPVVSQKKAERDEAAKAFGFRECEELYAYPPGGLDTVRFGDLVDSLRAAIRRMRPDLIYTVWPGDRHSDHTIVGKAILAAWPPWRGTVRAIRFCETISSTGADFVPDTWVDISAHLAQKLEIMQLYKSELREPPHPRSLEGIRRVAAFRGMQVGLCAAEAFKTAWAVG